MRAENAYHVASWTEHPYTSIKKRKDAVEHRVRLLAYGSNSYDVIHEVRHVPATGEADHWIEARVLECRPYGVATLKKRGEHLA